MDIGDTVVRKSYGKDVTFKIIEIKESKQGIVYIIKGINLRIIADSPPEDLEVVSEKHIAERDKLLDKKANNMIKSILVSRDQSGKELRGKLPNKAGKTPEFNNKALSFGRPGKILHIDGDEEYLNTCLKVYKQLSLNAIGRVVAEKNQPEEVLALVKENKPDIVVITGHDSMIKGTKDFMDLNNYRNSNYFVKTVAELRNYENSYDDLVIFAGACQSCYEAILDAGAEQTKLRFIVKKRK